MTTAAEQSGRATESPSEVASLVRRWEIGAIGSVRGLDRGAGRSRKFVVEAARGRYVLKIRPVEPRLTERVLRAHAVQRAVAAGGFPAVTPIADESGRTLVATELGLCELMAFVEGHSPRGREAEVRAAGAALARLHALLRETPHGAGAPAVTFHNRRDVLATCEALAEDSALDRGADLLAVRGLYERSASVVATAGWERWPTQALHGDWHPGNLLFAESDTPRLAAALDFDGLRSAPRADDLASAAVQFALRQDRAGAEGNGHRSGRAVIDAAQLRAFAEGYVAGDAHRLPGDAARAMPWAMAEAVIAEAIGRIVRQGGGPGRARTLVALARAAAEQLIEQSTVFAAFFDEGRMDGGR